MLWDAIAEADGMVAKVDSAALDFWKAYPYVATPGGAASEKEALLQVVQKLFPGQKLELHEPGTLGMSGNPVFVLTNAGGKRVGALKLYKQPIDFARELAGEETARSLNPESFRITRLEGGLQIDYQGKRLPLLFEQAEPGDDTRVTLTRLLASRDPTARIGPR